MLNSLLALVMAALPAQNATRSNVWTAAAPTEIQIASGSLLTWETAEATFVFVAFPISDVRITIDATRHAGSVSAISFPSQQPLAIVSGGTWSDRDRGLPKSEGFVVAKGELISSRHSTWSASGVLVHRGSRAEVLPIAQLGKRDRITEALEAKLLLLLKGQVNSNLQGVVEADWISVGTSNEAFVVSAVLHKGERTTTLPQFAQFIFDVATKRKLHNLTALNLDGACAVQLYIPSLRRSFACRSVSPTPNRIFVWQNDGSKTRR